MTVIDEIKARFDCTDYIGKRVVLKRVGKSWVGKCPFHEEKTGSFVVRETSYHCYGCGAKGDILDFVQQYEKMDLQEAMRKLAAEAGIALRAQTAEEKKAAEVRRSRQDILGAAMAFFVAGMMLPAEGEDVPEELLARSAGLRYAHGVRGFSLATIRAAGLGYFGKDWNGLREALRKAGCDLDDPVAVALVGYSGDVAGWGAAHGVQVAGAWVEKKRIPAIVPNQLIFPHMVHGRVEYLSGRLADAEQKGHWNLDANLVGVKQPYFNGVGRRDAKRLVIVEGQADAVTLEQWGIWAVGLAGMTIGGDLEAENRTDNYLLSVLSALAKQEPPASVVLGMDAAVGADNAQLRKIADLLLGMGFSGMDVKRVRWPAKDPNAWLQDGGTAAQVVKVLDEAQPWVIALATHTKLGDDEGVRKVFGQLARLDAFEIERVREPVAGAFGMRRRMFDGLLRQAKKDAGMEDDGQALYYVEHGRTYARTFDATGNETSAALCNFSAMISDDVIRDDGQNTFREFHINGKCGKRPLPKAVVQADEFGEMSWVVKDWGSSAIIEAGSRKRDQLRAAIQHLSTDVKRMTIYTHTGWRECDGKRLYLSNSGAIGGEDVQVDLDTDFEMYELPLQPQNVEDAMRASLSFLELAPDHVTFPIWASIWLAPLCELVNVAFTLWVYGGTGAMKSTVAALALNHFGPRWDDKHLPAGFLDTANRLEQKTFVAKDAILIIDDFAPQKNSRDQQEYVRTAARVVRNVGNLAGRGRMTADTRARRTYYPRGVVMITGEDIPQSEGVMGRLFVVEMNRGDVQLEKLSRLQARKGQLSHALSGYIAWLAENWGGLKGSVPENWRSYRAEMTGLRVHLRLPEAFAGLMVGLEMGLRYAQVLGVLTAEERAGLEARGKAALLAAGQQMTARVIEEKPERMFVSTIADLLTQGRIFLRPSENSGLSELLGGGQDKTELLGWYDCDWLYLMPEVAYTRVCVAFRERGNTFPVGNATLRKMLFEGGYLRADQQTDDNRRTLVIRVGGASQRVLALRRTALNEEK